MNEQSMPNEEHNSLYDKDIEILPNFFISYAAYHSKSFEEHKHEIFKAALDRWLDERSHK